MAEVMNDYHKIISESQLQALREAGYIIVKERDIIETKKHFDWLEHIIDHAFDTLAEMQSRGPGADGFYSLIEAIHELRGVEDE